MTQHQPSDLTHYDRLLGPRYTWMAGPFETLVERAQEDLRLAGANLASWGRAADLGAGLGQHAVALARHNWRVLAWESCLPLRTELEKHAARHPNIAIAERDWLEELNDATYGDRFDLVLCVGDTVCHLPNHTVLRLTIRSMVKMLAPGGRLILTLRDYSDRDLDGQVRVVPVKSDDTRIHTCLLNYASADQVRVVDLFHERDVTGTWALQYGEYSKIRIAPRLLENLLIETGATVRRFSASGGMVGIAASL